MFNCFDRFFNKDIRLDSLFKYIDLDYIYNNNFEPHFKNHIEKKFNTSWQNNDEYFKASHPTDISHIEWGNHLNEYIQSNYAILNNGTRWDEIKQIGNVGSILCSSKVVIFIILLFFLYLYTWIEPQ